MLPWRQIIVFTIVLSVLGVVVAFPIKRRFINDEQHPFPEGRACGVVLDALYEKSAATGIFKAKGLAPLPKLAGVDIRQPELSPTLDVAMIGAGGLMGVRPGASLLLGAALLMEALRIRTRNRSPLSPPAIGLGVVVPPDSTLMMFLGSLLFWYTARVYGSRKDSQG